MALSEEQKARLRTEAGKRGIDPDKLIAAAEAEPSDDSSSGSRSPAPTGEQPKLFMYLLPFVTVREVRQKWLGLTDSFSGDGEVAAKWAAKMTAGAAPSPALEPEE